MDTLSVSVFLSILFSVSGFVIEYRGCKGTKMDTSELTEGDALFLTPFIEKGQIEKGQDLAKVPPMLDNVESFAGYLTVNKSVDSNLFFWLFKSQEGDWEKRPLVVWLQGGPGASSMFGLFNELGPFSLTKNEELQRREYSWNRKCNLVFFDNPVGSGFSFTKQDSGFANDETDVARDLYEALVQLYKLFPTLQSNKLFITGESYAGKYIPAIGYKIYKENKDSSFKINLSGVMIGNAWTDPIEMMHYSSYLYKFGLIDTSTQKEFYRREDGIRAHIRSGQFALAYEERNELLEDFLRIAGFKGFYNLVNDSAGLHRPELYFVNNPKTRKAIHAGCYLFNEGNEAREHLRADIMQSVKPWVEELLAAGAFPIMFYSGQLDIRVAYPLSVAFYNSLQWPHASEYHKANRCQFKVGEDVAGYYKTAGTFTEVLVRNAGHLVPIAQPKWAYELLNRFVTNSSSFAC